MSTLKRENVKTNFQIITDKIETLEKIKPVTYITKDKYVPKIGLITDITTIKELVKLQSIIDKQKETISDSASKLGVEESELSEEEITYMGYGLDVWETDIKLRLAEIRNEILLAKLKKAKKVLKKNLSTDDKFELEMDSISDVLALDDFNS